MPWPNTARSTPSHQPRVVTTRTIRPAAAIAATVGPSDCDTATSTRTSPLVSGGAVPATVAVIVTGTPAVLDCGSGTPVRVLGGTTTSTTASPGWRARAGTWPGFSSIPTNCWPGAGIA